MVRAGSRFAVYGATGWLLEVVATGLHALLIKRDRSATSRSYLWMHPIYGLGGLLLERTFLRVRTLAGPVRCLHYVSVIYGVEYASGWLLRRVLGRCPWDYTASRLHVSGLVRIDYAPLWFGVALLFEPLRERLHTMGKDGVIAVADPLLASIKAPTPAAESGDGSLP